jgi:hypothetical protein
MGSSWRYHRRRRRKSVQADLGTIAKRCELMTEAMRSRTEAAKKSEDLLPWKDHCKVSAEQRWRETERTERDLVFMRLGICLG